MPGPGGPQPGFFYANPLRGLRNLRPARVDMGVDYSGTGPVYPLGEATVTEVDTSWKGGYGAVGPGTFIAYQLTKGPLAGYRVYVAENIRPSVRPGQHVTSSTPLGTASGGFETGFASGRPGQTAAAAAGQSLPPPQDPGGRPTAFGAAFSQVLAKLGAPAGVEGAQQPYGTLPGPLASALTRFGIGNSGLPSIGFGGLFGGLTELGHFSGVLVSAVTDVHMWISLGWLLLGGLLVFMGLYLWFRTSATYDQVSSAATSVATRGLA